MRIPTHSKLKQQRVLWCLLSTQFGPSSEWCKLLDEIMSVYYQKNCQDSKLVIYALLTIQHISIYICNANVSRLDSFLPEGRVRWQLWKCMFITVCKPVFQLVHQLLFLRVHNKGNACIKSRWNIRSICTMHIFSRQ